MQTAIVRSHNLPGKFSREWWRGKSRELFFFLTVVLHDSWKRAKFNDFGELQRRLCNFMDPSKAGRRRMFISVFRGSFKTTILLGYCVYVFCWAIAEKRAVSIVYNTATKDNAQAFMEDFRQTLSQNRLLHWIFPELPKSTDDYRSWTNSRVETFGGAKFHVASLETQQVGRHYEVIINDDWVNDKNAFSEIERENIKRKWAFQKAILTSYSRLGVGTEIDVGTLYCRGDLIDHIMRNSEGYDKFIVPFAIKNSQGKKVLSFPEIYTWEDFARKKKDMGRTLFASQYELRILDENAAITSEKWIMEWKNLPDNYVRYLIIDAAGTVDVGKRDPSAYLVADVDDRGRIFIRHTEMAWEETYEAVKRGERLARHFDVDETWYEREKFSISIAGVVDRIAPNFKFSLLSHKNEPPEKRVSRLTQYYETGSILHGPNQEELIGQVLNWPAVDHDDLLMCLAHLVRVMVPPRRGIKREKDEQDVDFHEEMKRNHARMEAIRMGPDMSHQF